MTDTRKRILILGLAREGESLARYFAAQGDDVTVTDSAPWEHLQVRIRRMGDLAVRFVLGGHHPELVEEADRFFVSPGVPESNPVYKAATHAGLPIESMTTLFFDLCPGWIVGITGSSGKTTTTGLIGHILQEAMLDVTVGGNIGEPMLDLLPRIREDTLVILELSSFQLSILRRSPHVAVVTNITPNHLDRHGTMQSYVEAKRHITKHQTTDDFVVLNAADPAVSEFAQHTPASPLWFAPSVTISDGATTQGDSLGLVQDGVFLPIMPAAEFPLPGRHNLENALAAAAAVSLFKVSPPVMARALQSFRTAPHRLQTVAERSGVRYIDDSIATSPARASVALRAIEGPVLLIAGGRDKNLPWDEFARLIVDRVRALFLIGEAAELIESAVQRQIAEDPGLLQPQDIYHYSSLQDAVAEASRLACRGDTVLLSPGCASYDMFSDFEERGAAFAHAVEAIDAA